MSAMVTAFSVRLDSRFVRTICASIG
jgi:hypothetical protein